MISSSRVDGLRLLDLGHDAARPRVIFLASAMSSGRWMKDSATQSMPASSAASRSERSFGGQRREMAIMVSGRLTPLRSESLPPTSTASTRGLPRQWCQPHLAVVEQQRVAGLDARRISGCGRCTRAASPGAGRCRA
jgi:hypothetical protein